MFRYFFPRGNKRISTEDEQSPVSSPTSKVAHSRRSASLPYATLKSELLGYHRGIAALTSLDPSPTTNSLFSGLVRLVASTYTNSAILSSTSHQDVEVQAIREELITLCARAEGRMECWWASRIASGQAEGLTVLGLRLTITDFPYYENYVQLCRLEYHFLLGLGASPRRALFIGSGPLPLTSALLAQHLIDRWGEKSSPSSGEKSSTQEDSQPWNITNVDIDEEANQMATQLCSSAFPSLTKGSYNFVTSSAIDLSPALIGSHDTIYLAALVGLSTESKIPIIRKIVSCMALDARLVIRSADELRSLIYPKLDEGELLAAGDGKLELEAVLHPRNQVVNSVIVFRRI